MVKNAMNSHKSTNHFFSSPQVKSEVIREDKHLSIHRLEKEYVRLQIKKVIFVNNDPETISCPFYQYWHWFHAIILPFQGFIFHVYDMWDGIVLKGNMQIFGKVKQQALYLFNSFWLWI